MTTTLRELKNWPEEERRGRFLDQMLWKYFEKLESTHFYTVAARGRTLWNHLFLEHEDYAIEKGSAMDMVLDAMCQQAYLNGINSVAEMLGVNHRGLDALHCSWSDMEGRRPLTSDEIVDCVAVMQAAKEENRIELFKAMTGFPDMRPIAEFRVPYLEYYEFE